MQRGKGPVRLDVRSDWLDRTQLGLAEAPVCYAFAGGPHAEWAGAVVEEHAGWRNGLLVKCNCGLLKWRGAFLGVQGSWPRLQSTAVQRVSLEGGCEVVCRAQAATGLAA